MVPAFCADEWGFSTSVSLRKTNDGIMTIRATIRDIANHPAPPLSVNESDLETLRALVHARTTEQRLVQRARIVLRAADGTPNRRIAAELSVAPRTVLQWRERYARAGLAGLADEPARDARRRTGARSAIGSSP